MIDALATQPHYVDHLLPVWRALPEEARGVFAARGHARERALSVGLAPVERLTPGTTLALVAAHADYVEAHETCGRPVAYLNHGVGQSWRARDGRLLSSGCGQARPGARVFLTPGPHATTVTREANGPTATIVQVGSAKVEGLRCLPTPREPLLVVSTHWDHRLVPESRPALPAYLGVLKDAPMPIALHAHPRLAWWAREQARQLGIEYIETFHEVCTRATIYATDSSSTLFEFAALDRPVIVVNGRAYRRDHHHGLRFWDAATVGVQVDTHTPEEFAAAVTEAALDAPARQSARAAAVALAYHPFDGQAAQRAAHALQEHA